MLFVFTVHLFLSGINGVDFSAFSYLLFHSPPELSVECQAFYPSFPDLGGRLIDLGLMMPARSAASPLSLSPLRASSFSPTLASANTFPLESDA